MGPSSPGFQARVFPSPTWRSQELHDKIKMKDMLPKAWYTEPHYERDSHASSVLAERERGGEMLIAQSKKLYFILSLRKRVSLKGNI